MAKPRIVLDPRGLKALLTSDGVRRHLEGQMGAALARARSTAPVGETGAYRESLRTWTEEHRTRVVVHMGSDVPYALVVNARTGHLSRALDAAGGRR